MDGWVTILREVKEKDRAGGGPDDPPSEEIE